MHIRTLRNAERAAMSWCVIAVIFVVGAAFRVTTIDRGTPTLGIAVYVVMLSFFFMMVAVPTGVVAGIMARFALRFAVSQRQLRVGSALIVAVVVAMAHGLGHRFPPWHVWATTAAITALLTLHTYRWGRLFVIAWRADRRFTGAPCKLQRIKASHGVRNNVRER